MNIKKLLKKIPLIDRIAYNRVVDLRSLPIEEQVEDVMKKYEANMGYRMDIQHPKTYTEKIQWYKLFYTGDGHLDRIVDKYLMKEYIKEKLGDGYTVPLIGAWESIEGLEKDWSKLPEEFCLKSTVQSQGKCIEFIHKKSAIDFDTQKKKWGKWLLYKGTLINSSTRAYHNCVPRIIAEQYLENVKNQLFDYKVYCFDGQPFCIESAKERFEGGVPTFTFYDLEWNKLEVTSGHHPNGDIPKPKHLDEMLELSKVLSKGFPHLRVDFFDTDEKLYVAELTLYTGGGYSIYDPQSFNEKMGELFKLPIDD
jgi:hypothetical protein